MNLNEKLLKSINDSMDNKGLSMELSSNLNSDYFCVEKEIKDGNIRTYISGEFMNSHMFLYTFAEMLKNNEVNISFNENTTEHHKNYLEKLSKDL